MSIVKLEPGQNILFDIASLDEVEGKFGAQYKITDRRGDVLFLNVDTVVKQLGRIGFTPQTAVGQTLEFERIEKNGTKYTNINKPGAAKLAAAPKANVKQELSSGPHIAGMDDEPAVYAETGAPPSVESGSVYPRLQKLFDVYDVCFDHVLTNVAPRLTASDIGSSPESVAAMTATLYISAKDAGLAR